MEILHYIALNYFFCSLHEFIFSQWLALIARFLVRFLCAASVWGYSRCSSFLLHSKNRNIRMIGDSKVPLGVSVCMNGVCVCVCDVPGVFLPLIS